MENLTLNSRGYGGGGDEAWDEAQQGDYDDEKQHGE